MMKTACVAVVLVVAGGAGCRRHDAAAAAESGPMAVRRGTIEDRFTVSGELQATNSEILRAPRTPGWTVTVRWIVEDGAMVKKGDRVVEFDSTGFSQTLVEKTVAVQRAETDLTGQGATDATALADKAVEVERKRVALEKARAEAAVPEDLRSKRDFQQKQKTVAAAVDDLKKAQNDVEAQRSSGRFDRRLKEVALGRARRELAEIEGRLGDLVLTAPRDGMVQIVSNWREAGRKYQAGDMTWGGLEIVGMPDLSAMQVHARLADVDEGAIRAGMKAECVLDTYPQRRLRGVVKSVSPVAQPAAHESIRQIFDVVVELLDQGKDPMLPGMSARVEVIRRRAEQALLVPRAALLMDGGKSRVRLGSGREEPVELEFCGLQDCVARGGPPEGTALSASPAVAMRGQSP